VLLSLVGKQGMKDQVATSLVGQYFCWYFGENCALETSFVFDLNGLGGRGFLFGTFCKWATMN